MDKLPQMEILPFACHVLPSNAPPVLAITSDDKCWPFSHFWRHHLWLKLGYLICSSTEGGSCLDIDTQIAVIVSIAFSRLTLHICIKIKSSIHVSNRCWITMYCKWEKSPEKAWSIHKKGSEIGVKNLEQNLATRSVARIFHLNAFLEILELGASPREGQPLQWKVRKRRKRKGKQIKHI